MMIQDMIAVDKRSSVDSSEILPKDYSPSKNAVLSGKGKACFNHKGNAEFRSIIKAMLPGYQMLKTKQEKTYVLSYIVEKIKGSCPDGIGFVRRDNKSGRWYELSDEAAREKVGFTLRQAARIPQSRQKDVVVGKQIFATWLSKPKEESLQAKTAIPDAIVCSLDVETVFPKDRSDLVRCTPNFVASEGPAVSEDNTLEELLANESEDFCEPFFKDVRPEDSILKSAWQTLSL